MQKGRGANIQILNPAACFYPHVSSTIQRNAISGVGVRSRQSLGAGGGRSTPVALEREWEDDLHQRRVFCGCGRIPAERSRHARSSERFMEDNVTQAFYANIDAATSLFMKGWQSFNLASPAPIQREQHEREHDEHGGSPVSESVVLLLRGGGSCPRAVQAEESEPRSARNAPTKQTDTCRARAPSSAGEPRSCCAAHSSRIPA